MSESTDIELNNMCGICYEILSSSKKCGICNYKVCNECFNQYVKTCNKKICPHCRASIPVINYKLDKIWYSHNQIMFVDNSKRMNFFSEKLYKMLTNQLNCWIIFCCILSFMFMSWLIGFYITKKKKFTYIPLNVIIGIFIMFIPTFTCLKLCNE